MQSYNHICRDPSILTSTGANDMAPLTSPHPLPGVQPHTQPHTVVSDKRDTPANGLGKVLLGSVLQNPKTGYELTVSALKALNLSFLGSQTLSGCCVAMLSVTPLQPGSLRLQEVIELTIDLFSLC